ncbi:MAG: peptidoglycan-binding protein [Myxococcales bacterium]|nr:peptidoglycan-binding protein [Myxococcales bacterium]
MSLERALKDRFLNLILKDSTGAPLSGRPFTLRLPDGTEQVGETDVRGRLSAAVPADAQTAELTVAWRTFALRLDALEPVTTVAGAQARLNHLNFPSGPVDGDLGPITSAALTAFQRAHELPATGTLDAATTARLGEAYGR